MIKFYRHSHSRQKSIDGATEHKSEIELVNYLAGELSIDKRNLSVVAKKIDWVDPDYTHIVLLLMSGDSLGVAGFSSGWFL